MKAEPRNKTEKGGETAAARRAESNATMKLTNIGNVYGKTLDISSLAQWSEPKEVQTRNGRRLLRKAQPTEACSRAWKAGKDALKSAGLSWSKDERTGAWEVCWWQPVGTEQTATENAAVAASRATDSDVEIPCPDGLAYMPFQRAGIAAMRDRANSLLADEQGLGKTVQAVGLMNLDPMIKRVLVVCPASLKINWRNEINRWSVKPLKVGVQVAGEPWVGSAADVVVLNYDILGKFAKDIYAETWDLLIADEAHFCKNRGAKRTKLLLGTAKKSDREEFPGVRARRKVLMTGTPILNKPVELFPLLESLQPGKWTFRDKIRYCAGFEGRWGWDFSGAAHLDELQNRLRREVMVRRLKKDVLTELPAKRRQIVELAANGASAAVEAENEAFAKSEAELTRLAAVAEVARLGDDEAAYKLAAENLKNAYRVAFTEMAKARHDVAVAKAPYVVEQVQNLLEDTDRVVVFGHHHDAINQIKAGVEGAAAVSVITGETPVEVRQEIVDRFNTSTGKAVLILGIRAAGVGLSVKAALEVFAEFDWTPGAMAQAEDRCHGIGRGIEGQPLHVLHLVLEGSLDAKMVKTLVAKQDIADKALDKNGLQSVGAEPVLVVTVGSVLDSPQGASGAETGAKLGAGSKNAPTATETPANRIPASVSDQLRALVHDGLRRLAGACDYASRLDGAGFNKFDALFGHALAERDRLTDGMVLAGLKLVTKYRRQLGETFAEQVKGLS